MKLEGTTSNKVIQVATEALANGMSGGLELRHFVAQLAHESCGFKYLYELGSRKYFKKYEGRKDLGNTQPGDGYRYRGRGFIQLTGRANYDRYGKLLGLDLVSNPELAATPDVAIKVAMEYWNDRKIGPLARADNIRGVTRRINGGYNGMPDRILWYNKVTQILDKNGVA